MPRSQFEESLRAAYKANTTKAERQTTHKWIGDVIRAQTGDNVPNRDGPYLVVLDRDPLESDEDAIKKAIVVDKEGNNVWWGKGNGKQSKPVGEVDLWVSSKPLISNKIAQLIYQWDREGVEVEDSK